jgi:NAD(P)-dependent dehydrogenase (short-subunit alcohol dehydrogenase family)
MQQENTKVAVVTGAGHGIGAATARWLAAEGWICVCADISAEKAQQTAAGIGGDAIACDVSSETDIARLVNGTVEKYGALGAIVSNAGIIHRKPLRYTSLQDWDTVIATNLTAPFLLAKCAEAQLRAAKGAIILIASTRAHMSEANTFAYSASKGGLVALTHSLAISLAPDVRVNCISPGWINVEDNAQLSREDHEQHPAGRVGKPDDIAAAVSFLLSEKAGFITGAEIVIDGGMTRKMIYAE